MSIPPPGATSTELAQALGGQHFGPEVRLQRVAPLEDAGPGELAYAERQVEGGAECVLCQEPEPGRSCIVVDDPKLAFIEVLEAWLPERERRGVHPTAIVLGHLGEGVTVGPYAVIGQGSVIEDHAVIYEGVVIGERCRVGAGSVLFPRVVLYANTSVGARCRIHAGAVIGADGFSYHPTPQGPRKVPQVGRVVIEDEVEIGANTCVDRAFLRQTRIGRGSKLDNLVQVGHNVRLGPSSVIAAQAGLSGSVTAGPGVMIGGQAGVVEHVNLGAGAMVGAGSGVMRDVEDGEAVLGAPAMPRRRALRVWALLRKLPELLGRDD
ncbi:MAG: UDP-3-O-(3-hydroxymyristoyl)glucosamine N-acyltransferase [Alphaproteobacteria bacterium]|nr:UDP-3-O-(3-hydroxymyristoyl)glucosamine N-acyltransferase [Alphaproteobacteria bacterium]